MKYTYLSLFLTVLLGLSGCGRKPIKQERIKPLTAESSDFNQTKNNIILSAKCLGSSDSKRVFNGIDLLNKQVQPIQLSVRNENDYPLTISERFIGLNLMNVQESQQLFVEDKTISGVAIAGLTVVGLMAGAVTVFGGLILTTLGTAVTTGYFSGIGASLTFLGIANIGIGAAMPIIIPVLVASSHTNGQAVNEQGLQNALGNSLVKQLVIEPHAIKDFVLLVKKEDYKNQFGMTVRHQNNATNFDIALPENKKKLPA